MKIYEMIQIITKIICPISIMKNLVTLLQKMIKTQIMRAKKKIISMIKIETNEKSLWII
jgi:hypothetical protein